MPNQYLVFLVLLMALGSMSLNSDKIVITMDSNRKNPTQNMHVFHGLFDNRVVKSSKEVKVESDLVSYCMLVKLVEKYSSAHVPLPSYIADIIRVEKFFNNKVEWKKWMKKIGLGDAIALSFDASSDPSLFPYPVMMKTKVHGGKGVSIIHSATEYLAKSAEMKAENVSFSLEESLTGLGMSEVVAFASAYKGKLLSLRCAKRTLRSSADTDPSTGIFISSFGRKFNYDEYWVACGKDLVGTIEHMAAAANISGVFCSNIKFDRQVKFKLMETNLRICASLGLTDGLAVGGYVSLAFELDKVNASSSSAHLNHVLYHGNFSRVFHRIRDLERRIVQTGGGQLGDKWIEADKFHPDALLDGIDVFYNPRNIFAGLKLIVAVTDSHLLQKLNNLPQIHDVFAFYSLGKYPLNRDVDLVLSSNHANLSAIVSTSDVPHLATLALSEKTAMALGFHNDLKHEMHQKGQLSIYGSVHEGSVLSLCCVEQEARGAEHVVHQQQGCGVETKRSVEARFSVKGRDYTGAFCGVVKDSKIKSIRAGLCPAVTLSDTLFISTIAPLAKALRQVLLN